MAAYATADDLLARNDRNVVAQLCGDDGHQVPDEDLAADPNLLAAIADASGDVEAALLVGERYSVADLEGLTGNSLAKLKRIVCTMAMAYLLERRPIVHVANAQQLMERAEQYLEQLRTGQRIFNVEDDLAKQTPTVNGPTSVKLRELNMVTERMNRYFPTSDTRVPLTRG